MTAFSFVSTAVLMSAAIGLIPLDIASAQSKIGHIFSANLSGNHVSEHDPEAGTSVGDFVPPGAGGLTGGTGIAFRADGDLFVASSATHAILRFDGESGAFIDTFIQDSILRRPFSIIFGPSGDLFVSSGEDHHILRYEGYSGRFRNVVADGLKIPIGLRFGPDGALYVANSGQNQVLRIDVDQGETEVFIEDGLKFPSDLVFTEDGRLFLTSAVTRQVLEFDATTGERVREVHLMPEGSAPVGIDIALDGDLIVADFAGNRLLKIDPDDGSVVVMSGGLNGPENVVVKRR